MCVCVCVCYSFLKYSVCVCVCIIKKVCFVCVHVCYNTTVQLRVHVEEFCAKVLKKDLSLSLSDQTLPGRKFTVSPAFSVAWQPISAPPTLPRSLPDSCPSLSPPSLSSQPSQLTDLWRMR